MTVDPCNFEQIVNTFYEALYRFALSLTQREAEASDLTQQTFYLWATRGHQLRDKTKLKSWLFTTLHREFLGARRRENRFPHYDIDAVDQELPTVSPQMVTEMDAEAVMNALLHVEDLYRAPLMLFYLEDNSYKEIAEILNIPLGTVMSRLARGKAQLRQLLADQATRFQSKIVPMQPAAPQSKQRP
jgi:RNA polymerase sigma-70 factor (ECF subfamily)